VTVTQVEGLDLVLEAHDFSGRLLARANEAPRGASEVIRSVGVKQDPLFFSVREVWIDGIPARNAPNLPYEIRATERPKSRTEEQEPNSTPEYAEPIDPEVVRSGHLNDVEDMDLYVLQPVPTEGRLIVVEVRSPPTHGIRLSIVDGVGNVQAQMGSVPRGQNERLSIYLAPVGSQPLHIAVQRRTSAHPFEGSATPYEIELTVPSLGSYVHPPTLVGRDPTQ
jgi:hypothetical protein